jgi:hypothetical protein
MRLKYDNKLYVSLDFGDGPRMFQGTIQELAETEENRQKNLSTAANPAHVRNV